MSGRFQGRRFLRRRIKYRTSTTMTITHNPIFNPGAMGVPKTLIFIYRLV
jgi:hypothetical protein